jgi:hypothetical protein
MIRIVSQFQTPLAHSRSLSNSSDDRTCISKQRNPIPPSPHRSHPSLLSFLTSILYSRILDSERYHITTLPEIRFQGYSQAPHLIGRNGSQKNNRNAPQASPVAWSPLLLHPDYNQQSFHPCFPRDSSLPFGPRPATTTAFEDNYTLSAAIPRNARTSSHRALALDLEMPRLYACLALGGYAEVFGGWSCFRMSALLLSFSWHAGYEARLAGGGKQC